MPDPWAPRLVKAAPAPVPVEPARVEPLQLVRSVEQVIVKEPVPARGWRFVPVRDDNNLIVEIIATPIE